MSKVVSNQHVVCEYLKAAGYLYFIYTDSIEVLFDDSVITIKGDYYEQTY